MKRVFRFFYLSALLLVVPPVFVSKAALAGEAEQTQSQRGWHKVENKRVCMVTDMEFPRDQIPVQVDGKTYYGCCENCKASLTKDETVRYAIDPVSGKKVNKATAIIAADSDGAVTYFENEVNFKKYLSSQKQ